MGSYNMDSHNCTRYVTKEGFVQNEGDVQVSPGGPYQISYDSLTPRESDCRNLLVPVCLSCSHIAYGSIRMEPVFMILGQSAGTAAALALQSDVSVQRIDRAKLTARLLADGQVLSRPVSSDGGLDPKKLEGIVVDDSQAERTGFEGASQAIRPFIGESYRHDGGNLGSVQKAVFRAKASGKYEVRVAYSANPNRRKNAIVVIHASGGPKEILIDQTKRPKTPPFHSIGVFDFNEEAVVEIRNDRKNANDEGHVIIDAVQFVRQ